MTTAELAIRLATASLLGGLVGLERHRADKAAGLRTHMLVCLGSALFMVVSAHGFGEVLRPPGVHLDPSRIAAQVVSGVGFLGAGTILRRKEAVFGLTTAASIWAVAAVGLASGGGMYAGALLATGLILLTLTGMRSIEDRIVVPAGSRVLSLLVEDDEASGRAADALARPGFEMSAVRFSAGERPGTRRVEATLPWISDRELLGLAARLQAARGTLEVRYERRTS